MDYDHLHLNRTTWRGLDAWRIAGPDLVVVLTRTGLQIASVTHPHESLNPLWQPLWKACQPAESQVGLHGSAVEAPLLAVICGHNLCIDHFGPPPPGVDRPLHGEAGILPWRLVRNGSTAVTFAVSLPKAALQVERILRLIGCELFVTTRVRHQEAGNRAIEWAEHPTLGDPFLEGAHITAGVDQAWTWPVIEPGSRFADLPAGGPVPPDEALAMPALHHPACGECVATRVVDGWWRVERLDLGRRLEYRWRPDEFPWMTIWTEHRSRLQKPWSGHTRARGLEFSTKPYPEAQVPPERSQVWHDRPTICLVPPGDGLEKTWSLVWSRC